MGMVVAVALLAVQSDAPLVIEGRVLDATGRPLPGATIAVGDTLVAVADDDGNFEISAAPGSSIDVAIALPGFSDRRVRLVVRPGLRIDAVLDVGRVEDRVTVVAPRPEEGVERAFALTPIQAYRVPGAQGDLLRAVQTLPGVVAPDDGAGLFVRGGDVGEVRFTLDDAVIAHPYRYETPTGGFQGVTDPLHVAGLSFSTGGFPARHGNTLSAVVDLRTLEGPSGRELQGTVGLAAASGMAAAPLGRRATVRATANRTFTGLLFAVNGRPRHFDPVPDGWDGSASVSMNFGRAGRLKTFGLAQSDEVGVQVERDAFVGLLRTSSRHQFAGTRWDGQLGRWSAAASVGVDSYQRTTSAGALDLAVEDRVASWRIDAARPALWRIDWRVGTSGAVNEAAYAGMVPVRGGDLAGIGGRTRFDADVADWAGGAYIEATSEAGPLSANIGARVDRFALARAMKVDPRIGLRMSLGGTRAIRLATGIYRQAPAPPYYDRQRGARRLSPMQAIHYIAGYETGRENTGFYLRSEAYVKEYTRLPLEDRTVGYTSTGYGRSRGVDLFAQWMSPKLELRGIGGFVHSRRRWSPADQQFRYELPDGTWAPDFDIPWTAQVIAGVPLSRQLRVNGSWRASAGRPHTPIVGGVLLDGGLAPAFGRLNSERFPHYARLDFSANWLEAVGGGAAVFFASVNNVLGRDNFFEYVYSADYSSRTPVVSASPRTVYFGVTFRR